MSSDINDTDLDGSVELAIDALRRYITVARGVRAEFEPEQADLDPRVEAASIALGLALGRLEDEFEDEIGFVPTIQQMWERDEDSDDGPDDAEQDGASLLTADSFSMGLVVGVDVGTSSEQLDGVLGVVDEAAGALVDRLESQGYVVTEYFVARGEHADRPADTWEDGNTGDDETEER